MIINRIFVAFLFLNIFVQDVFADDEALSKIDSMEAYTEENVQQLLSMVEQSKGEVKLKAIQGLAKLFSLDGNSEKAIEYLQASSKLAATMSRDSQIEALISWQEFESKRDKHAKSQEYAEQALELALPDSPLLPDVYHAIGFAQSQQLFLEEARKNLELAIQYYKQQNNLVGLKESYGTIGFIYIELADVPKGLEYLHAQRELIETLGSPADLASNYYSIANAYRRTGDPIQAEVFFKKSLEIDLTLGDKRYIAMDYRGISYSLYHQKRFTEALENNAKAIALLSDIDSPLDLSGTYIQQVYIYFELKDFEQSLNSLNQANEWAQTAGVAHTIITVNFLYGRQYIETKKPDLAIEYLNKAAAMAKELGTIDKDFVIFEMLSDAYFLQNNFEQAFINLKKHNKLKKALDTEEQRNKIEVYKRDINLLEEQLKVSQLEKTKVEQQQALEAKSTQQRQLYYVLAALVLLFFFALLMFWQRRKLSVLKVKLYEDALKQKQQLFADVSHELRTPLTALKLQISALQSNLVEDVNSGYMKLSRKVGEINRLIADIYQLAQADSLSIELVKEDLDLSSMFASWEQDWQTFIESAGLGWESHFELYGTRLQLDKDRIKQLIDNLLANCVHYTDLPGAVKLSAVAANGYLTVTIEDTAPSVKTKDLKNIFTRLYRVESSRNRQTGGSGLGLAICESLVKAHGGKIFAEQSQLGGLKVVFQV